MTDTQIINGLNKKSPEAFKFVFDMLHPALCMYANRIIDDREESRDLVAKTFLILWEKERVFENMAHLKSFLYVITRNACLDHMRNSRSQEGHFANISQLSDSSEVHSDRAIDEAEILSKLYAAINKLPNRCRKAFVLIHLENLNRAEVAEKLGISENTLRNQLHLARKRLRGMLGEKELVLALLLVNYAFLEN